MLLLKKNKIIAWILPALLLITNLSSAQDLFFKELPIFNDDSEFIIDAMLIDDNGLFWIASNEGLIESDGANIFRHPLPKFKESGRITALYQKGEIVYLGWENGMLSLYSTLLRKTLSHEKLMESAIHSIVLDNDENIWLASSENGVLILKGEEKHYLDVNFGLIDNIVNDLEFNPSNNSVYAATDRGISKCYFKKNKLKAYNYSSSEGLADNFITNLHFDHTNRLWAGSYSGKIFTLSEKDQFEEIVLDGWDLDKIISINSHNGSVWISSENKGVLTIDSHKSISKIHSNLELKKLDFTLITNDDKLLVIKNRSRILLSDIRIQFYFGSENPAFANNSMVYAHNGGLYIANDKGIYFKKNGEIDLIVDLEKEDIHYVISMLIDSENNLWFGSFDQGLFILKNDVIKQLTESDGLINNNIMTIHEWNDEIWVGTLGGLSAVNTDGESFTINSYSKNQGLNAAYIYQLYSLDANLYIATEGKGLIIFNGTEFINLSNSEIESVYDITGDGLSKVYVSSKKGGIIQFEGQKIVKEFPILHKNKALLIESISTLEEDLIIFDWELGFGLLNTRDGVYQLFESAFGLVNYTNDFLNVLSSSQDGIAYLGSSNYLIKYSQKAGRKMDRSSSYIRNVQLFSNPIDTSIHTFSYDENHFSFNIRSNWIQDPLHSIIEYRLLGLNADWRSTKDHEIIYPELDAGSYIFELRSGSASSIEHAQIKSYSFKIEKAFYKSWWFLCFLLFVLIGGVFAFTKFRDKQLVKEKKLEYERVLSQFELLKSQINPHFLFNSLNTAYALINIDTKEARDYLMNLSNYLRAILTKNQDHVIKLKKELTFAENYTNLQKRRFGDNLLLQFDAVDEALLESYIPPLCLQILIENAIKHNVISKTHPLTVQLYKEGDYFIIKNNKREKKGNGEGTKIGLSNIQSRYKLLFGKEIIIENTQESFIVKLPIIHNYVKNITD